jgi:hypothetical protein
MVQRVAAALAGILLSAVVGQTQVPAQQVDVTGAWDVTITMSGGSVSGLAVLSQDGPKVTGMLGPALTDMFPSRERGTGTSCRFLRARAPGARRRLRRAS